MARGERDGAGAEEAEDAEAEALAEVGSGGRTPALAPLGGKCLS